jgi:peptidylprolyl isomerase
MPGLLGLELRYTFGSMKRAFRLLWIFFPLLLTACGEKTVEDTPVPAATEPAKTEPAETAPAAAPETPKVDAPKTEPEKAAPPKNEPKPAAPKPDLPKETTLSSGLKMIDSKVGEGDAVKTGATISVHYTGWLYENGKRGNKFDSSVDRGQPFVFTVGTGVIQGWSDGVVGMKPGGKRELIIPPDLAYGPRGAGGGIIPPNATLDFEIELLQILR